MSENNFYRLIIKSFSLTILFSTIVLCQIPNSGFENWTNGAPDNWQGNSTAQFPTISQSTDAHSGSYSVKGTVVSFSGFSFAPALVATFPYTQRPSSLSGYYKFNSVGSDTLLIIFASYKNNSGIGGGVFETYVSANSYTQFNIPITYISSDTPDSVGIEISIKPIMSPHSGSTFNIDDLSFTSGATAVNENSLQAPQAFELKQNYPNPFNPTTTIEYQIPKQSYVVLKIYDVLGNQKGVLVNNNEPAGNYYVTFDGSKYSGGVYFYKLEATPTGRQAGYFTQTKKFILLK